MKLTEERARELIKEIVNEFLKRRKIEDREIIDAWMKAAWDIFEEWDCTEEEVREIYSDWLINGEEYL